MSSLLPHSVCKRSHKANPEPGEGNGPHLLMKDHYACTGIGGIICGSLAIYLYNTLLFLSFYNALIFLIIFFDAHQSFITDYLPSLNTSIYIIFWELWICGICCSFFLLKKFYALLCQKDHRLLDVKDDVLYISLYLIIPAQQVFDK